MFGVEDTSAESVGNGLPTRAMGLNGVSKCEATSRMPSNNIIGENSVVHIAGKVYSFGGKKVSPNGHGSDEIYMYSLNTDTWTQLQALKQRRYAAVSSILNENEIFFTGK